MIFSTKDHNDNPTEHITNNNGTVLENMMVTKIIAVRIITSLLIS